MYEQYFSFKRPPFSIAPDPSFLYPSPQHRDGLEHLLYGLQKEGGFIILTGEVGTGKTTLCRFFLRELPDTVCVATVLNAKLNSDDLLANICCELAINFDEPKPTTFQKSQAISQTLERNHAQGLKTLLIIEEAQNLNPDALETLRLLTNIETDTTKLLHILLIGQPELVATLNRPDLRQLSQRIIARFHLQPLSLEQTSSYITHRLTVAGGQLDVFKKSTVKALYEEANGIPRLINLIADRTLLDVYNVKSKYATRRQVKEASRLIKTGGSSPASVNSLSFRHWLIIVTGFALVVIALIYSFYHVKSSHYEEPKVQAVEVFKVQNKPQVVTKIERAEAIPQNASPSDTKQIDIEALLLQRWKINTKNGDLCRTAAYNNLQCLDLSAQSLDDLIAINRPAIVTVFNPIGVATPMLVRNVTPTAIELVNAQGNYVLNYYNFNQRWRGDLRLLWQPPPGYIDPLSIGDKSYQTVFWLQDALNQLGLVDGKIITGGIYNALLANKVKKIQKNKALDTDGILGEKTIIAINTQLKKVPLIMDEANKQTH